MVDSMPLRLHRAASIISRSGDPGAADAQSTCAEVAARLVDLEQGMIALLEDSPGAREAALKLLGEGRWLRT